MIDPQLWNLLPLEAPGLGNYCQLDSHYQGTGINGPIGTDLRWVYANTIVALYMGMH